MGHDCPQWPECKAQRANGEGPRGSFFVASVAKTATFSRIQANVTQANVHKMGYGPQKHDGAEEIEDYEQAWRRFPRGCAPGRVALIFGEISQLVQATPRDITRADFANKTSYLCINLL